MSPRKSRYKVPKWRVQSIRDKRKKILYGPYACPQCGQDKLRININKQNNKIVAFCVCGLKHLLKYVSGYDSVDYYNELIDQFSSRTR